MESKGIQLAFHRSLLTPTPPLPSLPLAQNGITPSSSSSHQPPPTIDFSLSSPSTTQPLKIAKAQTPKRKMVISSCIWGPRELTSEKLIWVDADAKSENDDAEDLPSNKEKIDSGRDAEGVQKKSRKSTTGKGYTVRRVLSCELSTTLRTHRPTGTPAPSKPSAVVVYSDEAEGFQNTKNLGEIKLCPGPGGLVIISQGFREDMKVENKESKDPTKKEKTTLHTPFKTPSPDFIFFWSIPGQILSRVNVPPGGFQHLHAWYAGGVGTGFIGIDTKARIHTLVPAGVRGLRCDTPSCSLELSKSALMEGGAHSDQSSVEFCVVGGECIVAAGLAPDLAARASSRGEPEALRVVTSIFASDGGYHLHSGPLSGLNRAPSVEEAALSAKAILPVPVDTPQNGWDQEEGHLQWGGVIWNRESIWILPNPSTYATLSTLLAVESSSPKAIRDEKTRKSFLSRRQAAIRICQRHRTQRPLAVVSPGATGGATSPEVTGVALPEVTGVTTPEVTFVTSPKVTSLGVSRQYVETLARLVAAWGEGATSMDLSLLSALEASEGPQEPLKEKSAEETKSDRDPSFEMDTEALEAARDSLYTTGDASGSGFAHKGSAILQAGTDTDRKGDHEAEQRDTFRKMQSMVERFQELQRSVYRPLGAPLHASSSKSRDVTSGSDSKGRISNKTAITGMKSLRLRRILGEMGLPSHAVPRPATEGEVEEVLALAGIPGLRKGLALGQIGNLRPTPILGQTSRDLTSRSGTGGPSRGDSRAYPYFDAMCRWLDMRSPELVVPFVRVIGRFFDFPRIQDESAVHVSPEPVNTIRTANKTIRKPARFNSTVLISRITTPPGKPQKQRSQSTVSSSASIPNRVPPPVPVSPPTESPPPPPPGSAPPPTPSRCTGQRVMRELTFARHALDILPELRVEVEGSWKEDRIRMERERLKARCLLCLSDESLDLPRAVGYCLQARLPSSALRLTSMLLPPSPYQSQASNGVPPELRARLARHRGSHFAAFAAAVEEKDKKQNEGDRKQDNKHKNGSSAISLVFRNDDPELKTVLASRHAVIDGDVKVTRAEVFHQLIAYWLQHGEPSTCVENPNDVENIPFQTPPRVSRHVSKRRSEGSAEGSLNQEEKGRSKTRKVQTTSRISLPSRNGPLLIDQIWDMRPEGYSLSSFLRITRAVLGVPVPPRDTGVLRVDMHTRAREGPRRVTVGELKPYLKRLMRDLQQKGTRRTRKSITS
ncbi:hypothetical protein AAMO2058_000400300 [Amorphochlora amoebiformis]